MTQRAYLRGQLARFINSAAYATRVARYPGFDREGCKRTAHDFIVKAIAVREQLKRLGGK